MKQKNLEKTEKKVKINKNRKPDPIPSNTFEKIRKKYLISLLNPLTISTHSSYYFLFSFEKYM